MGILAIKVAEFDKLKSGIVAGKQIPSHDVPASWLQKLQSEIDAIRAADPDGTNELKAAVANLVWWEREMEINPCPGGGLLSVAWEAVESAGKKDSKGVWDILRSGTEDEFSALCNCLPEIGGEFDDDDNSREIMRISKRRLATAQNYDNLMAGIKGGFGCLFDQFWNELESAEPVNNT